MPGKTRVSALAKELGITSREALAELSAMGEYVKSASSTIEGPAAAALRRRCTGAPRPPAQRGRPRTVPRNNPYMDLGRTEIDHLQAADWRPRSVVAPPAPAIDPLSLPVVRARRPRREWYRGNEPGEFDRIVLERIIVLQRDPYTRPPQAPCRYFEDEVEEARDISGRWMSLLLEGMDYDEVLDWRECLDPLSVRSFIVDYPNAPEHAIELHAAGVSVPDLRWRPEDQEWGTLPDRLRRRTMSVAEVITEVRYRRAEDA